MSTESKIQLSISTPEKNVVSCACDEICLPGPLGPLGLLPNHAPLITTILPGKGWYQTGTTRKRFSLSAGLTQIKNNHVNVLVEQACLENE